MEGRGQKFLARVRKSLESARSKCGHRALFQECDALLTLAETAPNEFERSVMADDIVHWGVRNGLLSRFEIGMVDLFTCEL